MNTIELTRGLVTIVDDSDFEWLNQWNWYAKPQTEGGLFYACRTATCRNVRSHISMSRLILNLRDGDGLLADHRNGDTLDNRRENLRVATHGQNARNQKLRVNNKVGLKGVFSKNGRWVALIQVDLKRIFLGSFTTPEQAHAAYCEAARRYHGDFARTA